MISAHSKFTPGFAATAPLGYLIHEVSRHMKRRFEEEARTHGVTLPQWRALAEISRTGGITQVNLAACIDTDPMTLSGVLDRLEKRGLIERYPDPNDSRAKLAKVTPQGMVLIDKAKSVGLQLYSQAVSGLSDDEQALLARALTRMRENLQALNAEQKELAE